MIERKKLMREKVHEILFYILVGAGYLLVCSTLPTLLASELVRGIGGDGNLYYALFSFLTGICFVRILFRKTMEKMEIFSGISLGGILEAIGTAALLFVVINFFVSPGLALLFPESAGTYESGVSDMMQTPVATFLQVAVIAPLWEELIFRGFIMKRALRFWSPAAAVFLTAFLFGALHMSLVQGISAAAAGLLLCLLYVRRRSVGLNIFAHGIYNGMVFLLAMKMM